MERRRSLGEYRAIDLVLFAGMVLIFEFIIVRAANWWFPGQPFTVSLAAAITSIVFMRWGAWGGIHAFLAGLVFCFFSSATLNQFLVYSFGNLFSLAALLAFRIWGKEKVRTGNMGMLFPIAVLALMQTGRAVVAIVLGAEPLSATGFYTTDSLSYIFTFVIVWISRKLDGVYEDQIHYLLRLQAREREERRG